MTEAERARRAILVLGLVALGLGALGAIVSWSTGFSASRSRQLGWPQHELAVLTFNLPGALVTLACGALAAAGAVSGRRILVVVAIAGFALVSVQALVQAGRAVNWLGASGSNFGLAIGLGAGLAVAEWARACAPGPAPGAPEGAGLPG